jgi:flagellar biosynthetic protein FlhB
MEDSFQEKTENPTPKRLKEARERGFVAKSPLLASGILLLFGVLGLYFFGSALLNGLKNTFYDIFAFLNSDWSTIESVSDSFKKGIFSLLSFLLPLLGFIFVSAIYGWLLQIGFLTAPKALKPNWGQLNIFNASSYKRLFGLQSLIRLFQDLCKLATFFVVTALFFYSKEKVFLWVGISSTNAFFTSSCYLAFLFSLVLVLTLILFGIIDFAFQKWHYKQELRMTKQEVKEELRDSNRMTTPKI